MNRHFNNERLLKYEQNNVSSPLCLNFEKMNIDRQDNRRHDQLCSIIERLSSMSSDETNSLGLVHECVT